MHTIFCMRLSFFKKKNTTKTFHETKKYKQVFCVVFCLVCVAFLVFSPAIIFDKNNYSLSLNKYLQQNSKSQVVLSLYHIETFEGGSASRKTYLQRQAMKYNKLHNNCYIIVNSLTPQELDLNISQKNIPDMYSFGVGVGDYLIGFLSQLEENNNVRKDLSNYGKKFGKTYAYPYILSGYALITKGEVADGQNILSNIKNTRVGKKEIKGISVGCEYTNPYACLLSNNAHGQTNSLAQFESQYEAYANFVSGGSLSLLGTARDVSRVKNRELNGKISPCSYQYLGKYSDLVQYISVTNNLDKTKSFYAQDFAKFLTTNTCQKDLTNYGLFSVDNENYYQDEFSYYEETLHGELTSISAFAPFSEISSMREQNLKSVFN